ncbi:DDE_3 domain-containing protein [Trichonephila clavipes]|nr:DDE_3 domain-containing protein [Trichonephila clavipes]
MISQFLHRWKYQNAPCSLSVHRLVKGNGVIILWRTFSWLPLVFLILVERILKVIGYICLIADQLHPYMEYVFPTGDEIFQQEGAPCNKKIIVLEGGVKNELQLISQPFNLDDLNLIWHN